jgi:hypothetical protein
MIPSAEASELRPPLWLMQNIRGLSRAQPQTHCRTLHLLLAQRFHDTSPRSLLCTTRGRRCNTTWLGTASGVMGILLRVSCSGRASSWPLLNSGSKFSLVLPCQWQTWYRKSTPSGNTMPASYECRSVSKDLRERGEVVYMTLPPGCIFFDQRTPEKH